MNPKRLQAQHTELQQTFELLTEKIGRLRHDHAIKTDTLARFELEKQIADEEVRRQQVEDELHLLERQIQRTHEQSPDNTHSADTSVSTDLSRSSAPNSNIFAEVFPRTMRQLLIQAFNETELRDLCFDMEIDYEILPGSGKADTARELILFCQRHGRYDELVRRCHELRPVIFTNERNLDTRETALPPPVYYLKGLASATHPPRIREELAQFRTIFQGIRDQIGVLNCFKELHDVFQDLEKLYNIAVHYRKRLVTAPEAWDELFPTIIEMQICITGVLEIMRNDLVAAEFVWGIQQLEREQSDLDAACDRADPQQFDRTIGRLKRVLTRDISRSNTRLVSRARSLRLDALTEVLRTVRANLTDFAPGRAALEQITGLITALDDLRQRLTEQVDDHNRWQEIDNELRRIADSLIDDIAELESAWADLAILTESLFANNPADWAAKLNRIGTDLVTTLAGKDMTRARRLFISYHSQASRRFATVDDELLKTCNELWQIGKALDLLLEAIDDEHARIVGQG